MLNISIFKIEPITIIKILRLDHKNSKIVKLATVEKYLN